MYNKTLSDALSHSQGNERDLTKNSHNKKRYKHWSNEDEEKLVSLIKLKDKSIAELNDKDWIEMA